MQSVNDPQPASAGALLAATRRERGLTVDEVSARTRVRASLIEQIERDDYSHCGGTVYARGHLRSIAGTLGLDPGPVLAAYDASHESLTGPVLVVPPGEFDPLRGGPGRRGGAGGGGGFRWGTAMIVSLAVVCLVAVVLLLLPDSGSSGDSSPSSRQQASAAPSAPPAPVTLAPTPSATPVPTTLNVVLAAKDGQSWLEVRDDARHVLLSQMLNSGDSRTVTAPGALHIRLGNAGAVDVSCNGRSLGPSGGPGQVVTITVSLAASGSCEVGQDGRSPLTAATAPSVLPSAGATRLD